MPKKLEMEDIKLQISELVRQAAIDHPPDNFDEFVQLLDEQKKLEVALKSFFTQLSKVKIQVNKKERQNEGAG